MSPLRQKTEKPEVYALQKLPGEGAGVQLAVKDAHRKKRLDSGSTQGVCGVVRGKKILRIPRGDLKSCSYKW
jgi:hypothetical protein